MRVRDGWPVLLGGSGIGSGQAWFSDVRGGLSELAFYVAPVSLLAADFGSRIHGRKQVAMAGLMGVALPVFGSLLLVGVINAATLASRFYQPSLEPSVGMALWSKAASSTIPGRMLIVAITMFGAVRFGARALAQTASIRIPVIRRGWALLGCFAAAAAWLSWHPYAPWFTTAFEFLARCLGVTNAVVTGDFLMGRRAFEEVKKIDRVGLFALAAGLAMPLYVPHGPVQFTPDPWWYPWLLPCYVVTLVVCLCGRAVQRIEVAAGTPHQ